MTIASRSNSPAPGDSDVLAHNEALELSHPIDRLKPTAPLHRQGWMNNEALLAKLSISVKVTTSKAKTKPTFSGRNWEIMLSDIPAWTILLMFKQSVARSPYNGGIWNTIRQLEYCTSRKGQILFKLVYEFRSPWMCFVLCCRVGEKVDAIPFMSLNTHFRKQKYKLCGNKFLITKIRSSYVAPFWKRIYFNILFPPLKQLNHIQILFSMFDGFPKLSVLSSTSGRHCFYFDKLLKSLFTLSIWFWFQ